MRFTTIALTLTTALAAAFFAGCGDDESGLFDCFCAADEVCRQGVCITPDAGGDDMGELVCEDDARCPACGTVFINEIVISPGENVGATAEFIEIAGPPGTSLNGFSVQTLNGNGGQEIDLIRLEGDIPTNGYFVLAFSPISGADLLADGLSLQDGPDNVVLRDCGGQQIDAIGYEGSEPFGDVGVFAGEGDPAPRAGSGESLARCPGDDPDSNDNAADFHVSLAPTPGEENAGFEDPFNCETCEAGQFTGEIVINEVLYNPDGTDDGNEFIELAATGRFNLLGLTLMILNDEAEEDVAELVRLSGRPDRLGFVTIGNRSDDDFDIGSIQNGPESVVLVDCAGEVIDAVSYGTFEHTPLGEGTPHPGVSDGESLSRCAPDSDSDNNAADFAAAEPTPSFPNRRFVDPRACGGTGCEPGILDGRLSISEMAPGSDGFIEFVGDPGLGLADVTLELYNAEGTNVGQIGLSGAAAGNGLTAFTLSALEAAAGSVELFDCNGDRMEGLAWGTGTRGDGEAAPAISDGESLARCPGADASGDNATDFHTSDAPTRGEVNDDFVDEGICEAVVVDCVPGAAVDDLVINEVLPNPPGTDTTEAEFIELYGSPGLGVTDMTVELVNGSNLEVYASGTLSGGTDEDGFFVISGRQLPGAIQQGPDAIRLIDCDGVTVLDELAYGVIEGDEVPGEGAPAEIPSEGLSIARCPLDEDSDDNATDFGAAAPTRGGGNSGFIDSDFCDVPCDAALVGIAVINELFPNEPGSEADADIGFIELRGEAGASLTGARLELINGEGGADDPPYRIVNLSGSIPGDGLVLVGESDLPGVDVALSGDLQGGPDSVVLIDCNGDVIDAVAYDSHGDDDRFAGEGEAFSPVPDGQTFGRCGDAFDTIDSDDNSADFHLIDTGGAPEANAGEPNPTCGPTGSGDEDAGAGDADTGDASDTDAGDAVTGDVGDLFGR